MQQNETGGQNTSLRSKSASVWFGAGLGCLSSHSLLRHQHHSVMDRALALTPGFEGLSLFAMRHFHQNIRFNAQSKLEEPLPQPHWVMYHILLSKMLKAFSPDLCYSMASKSIITTGGQGMDGLMQNHSSKTIIIIINDRRPGVASTATEKRRNHRQSLQNNFKNSIFS